MLDNNDLDAIKNIIKDELRQHIFTCLLAEGFTHEELKLHGINHRQFKDSIASSVKMKKVYYYIIGILISVYFPLIIKLLWP